MIRQSSKYHVTVIIFLFILHTHLFIDLPKQALWKIEVPVVLSEESVVEEVVVEGTLDDVDIVDVVVDMLHDVGS